MNAEKEPEEMNNWRKPCEHGVYVGEHWESRFDEDLREWIEIEGSRCPGGSPVTAADLEAQKQSPS